ncbi:MAG: polysaccharide biosynthesis/export family protein [Janthinobacterium lividum]
MFQLTKGADGVIDTAKLRRAVNRTDRNYRIHANDVLSVQVYTNRGERLIDPNGELQFGSPSVGGAPAAPSAGTGSSSQHSVGQGAGTIPSSTQFVVQADGTARLPLVDRVKVQGLTLIQADSILQLRYNEYYKQTFVKTAVANNRVIVLGSPGGQVIPLANDNMNLLEVLALSGGADGSGGTGRYGGRINNIRIIRGDLKNPQVQFVDLSTLEGMRRGNLQVEPNDIIYIQPIRRPLLESLGDAGPVFSLFTILLTSASVIYNLTR